MGSSKYSSNFLKRFAPALLIAAFAALGIFVIWGIWRAAFPPLPPMQGQMEARVINVSSKTPGRVGAVLAREGDFVREGQPVALMHLPELEAKLSQAIAQEHAAKAKESLVDEGARPQERKRPERNGSEPRLMRYWLARPGAALPPYMPMASFRAKSGMRPKRKCWPLSIRPKPLARLMKLP